MRWLLVLALVNGLVPSAGELVEIVGHEMFVDHAAHAGPADPDFGAGEHGCGAVAHICQCCPNQSVEPSARSAGAPKPALASGGLALVDGALRSGFLRAPFRPPIG